MGERESAVETEKLILRLGRTEFARKLRKNGTLSEKLLWEQIRKKKMLGFKFRRQHIIRGFILDFYCHELKLALEIDGKIHESQKEYDRFRQEIIEREGVTFLRIDVEDIDMGLPLIVDKIRRVEWEMAQLAGTKSPSPAKRQKFPRISAGEG